MIISNVSTRDVSNRVFNWSIIHRRPSVIFVSSMPDVGHPSIRPGIFERMFSIMCGAGHRPLQALTKGLGVMDERLVRL
jgi:protein gp37